MLRTLSIFLTLCLMACGVKPVEPRIWYKPDNQDNDTNNEDQAPGPNQDDDELPQVVKTIYVNLTTADEGNGSQASPFKTIQMAIDKADKDTEIKIAAGEYVESLILKSGVVMTGGYSPSFSLRKPEEFLTIIRDPRQVGAESLVEPISTIRIEAGDEVVVIDGVDIIGASVDKDTNSVTQYDEVAVGIFAKDSTNVIVKNSKISGGDSGQYTVGVATLNSAISLQKNLITGGKGYTSYGIYFTGNTTARVSGNIIIGGNSAGSTNAIVAYEFLGSSYTKNLINAGQGLQKCFGARVSTTSTGAKSFYNNVFENSSCSGENVGMEIWGNSLRSGSIFVRNNSISSYDNNANNKNTNIRLTTIHNGSVEITNNMFYGDRRTTEAVALDVADANSRVKMFRHNNYTNCNNLYRRVSGSGEFYYNTISSIENSMDGSAFGNLAVDVTFGAALKPAENSNLAVLTGGIDGAAENWLDLTDYNDKPRTKNSEGKGWTIGAYEMD